MSFDFATQQLCTHEVFFERMDLDPVTLDWAPFPRPPASNRIEVYIDSVLVPSSGLYSKAAIPFAKKEPYRIKAGVNDLLYIRIGFNTPRFVQLIPGSKVKAKDLAKHLQQEIPELVITEQNKRVHIETLRPTNGAGFSFPDPRWTDTTSSLLTTVRTIGAYNTVGIIPGRVVRGKKIFPGWHIEKDVESPFINEKRLKFSGRLPSHDPVIEVNYVTTSIYCRRCHGSRIEFDYGVSGDTYEEVRNLDLLAQEFDKFVFTKLGSHFKWQWLGSYLIDRIGAKSGPTANALITVDVSEAFRTYQSIKQQQDEDFPAQRVSDAEYPFALGNLQVQIAPSDPTVAEVRVTVVTRSQEPIYFQRIVGNPNPYQLSGDPIQNLRLNPRWNFLPRG